MNNERRRWMKNALGLAASPVAAMQALAVLAQQREPQRVKLVAQRFRYTPDEFRVTAGQPVVLEFTALDFVHGFNMPDLKLRADLPPGVVTRLAFTVDQPGVYDFLCDNFCGDRHEDMAGRMIVIAAA